MTAPLHKAADRRGLLVAAIARLIQEHGLDEVAFATDVALEDQGLISVRELHARSIHVASRGILTPADANHARLTITEHLAGIRNDLLTLEQDLERAERDRAEAIDIANSRRRSA